MDPVLARREGTVVAAIASTVVLGRSGVGSLLRLATVASSATVALPAAADALELPELLAGVAEVPNSDLSWQSSAMRKRTSECSTYRCTILGTTVVEIDGSLAVDGVDGILAIVLGDDPLVGLATSLDAAALVVVTDSGVRAGADVLQENALAAGDDFPLLVVVVGAAAPAVDGALMSEGGVEVGVALDTTRMTIDKEIRGCVMEYEPWRS